MGLQKQPLFVPVGGLETEIDDKLLPTGRMMELENAYMPRQGECVKRFGTSALPAPGSVPFTLATHKNALVALPHADPLNVLATPTSTEWVRGIQSGAGNNAIAGAMGAKMSVGLAKVAPANRGIGEGPVGDVAYGAGFYFVAYLDAANSQILHFTAMDATTGHVTMDTKVANGADFRAWRVVFQDNRGVLVWWDTTNAIGFVTLNPAVSGMAPTTTATAATSTGVGFELNLFDAQPRGSTVVMVAYRNAAGNVSGIDFVPSTGGVTLWQPLNSAGGAITAPGPDAGIGWMQDFGASGKVALIILHNTNGVFVHFDIPTAGATRQAVSSYNFPTITTRGYVTGHTVDADATGHFIVVCNQGGPSTDENAYVIMASRLAAVGLTTGPILYRGTTLRSKTWTYQGDYYIVGAFAADTSGSGTHYVLKIPVVTTQQALAPPLATFAVRQGTGAYFSGVASPAAGTYTISTSYTVRLESFGVGSNPDVSGVELAQVKFQTQADTTIGQPKEAIDSLFVPGGQLRQFDGVTYGEASFAYPPEQPTLTPAAAGVGLVDNSDYYYSLIYSRMDAQGRLWRSDASVPKLTHTGAGQRQVTVACPTLRLTGWANVQIEIYRGSAGVGPDSSGVFTGIRKIAVVANNITVDSVNYVDVVPDSAQASGEDIYTSGGILGNDTPPGFISICVAQNRLWGIPADDPQSVWYSKEFAIGQGLGWSEDFVIDVRDERGPLRGLSVIDNKPIAWKDDALNVCLGTGPNNLDQGGTYVFEVSSRGFGSSNAMALCETKDGAMFVSTSQRAGIFLLDRALTAQYIGAPVQRFIGETVTAGIYVSKLNQARFYTLSGRTMVYDLVNGQWSTFTGQPCLAAISWNGVPVFVSNNNNHVLYEKLDGSLYTEDGTAFITYYGFPWLQINQIKGFERFYRVQPVGERKATLTGGATMKLYANFDTLTALSSVNFANTGTDLKQELRYSAKLAAVKVVIEDDSSTAGLAINGYTMIVAAKAGLRPITTKMV